MLSTSEQVAKALLKMGDDIITVEIENKEYVIEFAKRKPNYSDSPMSHICLVCRDGGQGYIRR